MLTREAPFNGGMGNVVPGGGPEITGVFVLVVSLLLQAADNSRLQRQRQSISAQWRTMRKGSRSKNLCAFAHFAFQISCRVILDCGSFSLFLGERFTGDSIFTFNPPAEIDKLTPLRTEGTKRIVFPLDRLTAGWAFHES